MRVFCAPVDLHSKTRECLERFAPDAEIVWLERGDRFAYWREIKKRWKGEEDLLIIEQDMEWDDLKASHIREGTTGIDALILRMDKEWSPPSADLVALAQADAGKGVSRD